MIMIGTGDSTSGQDGALRISRLPEQQILIRQACSFTAGQATLPVADSYSPVPCLPRLEGICHPGNCGKYATILRFRPDSLPSAGVRRSSHVDKHRGKAGQCDDNHLQEPPRGRPFPAGFRHEGFIPTGSPCHGVSRAVSVENGRTVPGRCLRMAQACNRSTTAD